MKDNQPKYTHFRWYFGVVPIRIADLESGDPVIETRGVPEFTLDLAEMLVGCCMFLMSLVNPEFVPMYAIKLTGEYDENGKKQRLSDG